MAVLNTTDSRGVNIRLAASFCARQTLPPMHPTVERLYLAARALEKLSIPAKVALALEESQQTLKHWEARGSLGL